MKNGEQLSMIHNKFLKLVDWYSFPVRFLAPLMEKYYYMMILLSRINELSEDFIFKGGTCLNKIFYSYYRLSEDLDFSMHLPDYTTARM